MANANTAEESASASDDGVGTDERAVRTERVLTATPREIFAAFEVPEVLARWWGPNDFTNTFDLFEFRPDGRWIFTMHGPHGSYPNESIFRVVDPDRQIVIDHVSQPRYRLTIDLTPQGPEQTHLAWAQVFETAELAAKMRPICTVANEQVIDRLAAALEANR